MWRATFGLQSCVTSRRTWWARAMQIFMRQFTDTCLELEVGVLSLLMYDCWAVPWLLLVCVIKFYLQHINNQPSSKTWILLSTKMLAPRLFVWRCGEDHQYGEVYYHWTNWQVWHCKILSGASKSDLNPTDFHFSHLSSVRWHAESWQKELFYNLNPLQNTPVSIWNRFWARAGIFFWKKGHG